jgi:hypothetical protein
MNSILGLGNWGLRDDGPVVVAVVAIGAVIRTALYLRRRRR